MISAWWWSALGVAGLGALVLAMVNRALHAERRLVEHASERIDRALGLLREH